MPIWNGEDGARDLAAEIAEDRAQRRDRIAHVVSGDRSAEARLSYHEVAVDSVRSSPGAREQRACSMTHFASAVP
jgi:hypothetical protein